MAHTLCSLGTGYVGLVFGALFAEKGNRVICADINADKIAMLNRGEMPIYEPGLEEIVHKCVRQGTLSFTTDHAAAIAASEASFIAVGTPYRDALGGFDPTALYAVIDTIARVQASSMRKHYAVIKSTISPDLFLGAQERLVDVPNVVLVSCPEFLREGRAVEDTHRPDRIVIGTTDPDAAAFLRELHMPFCQRDEGKNILVMHPVSAILTKLGANTMRAARVGIMNELAEVCDMYGGDVQEVRLGIGADAVVGDKFLYAGPGYGGSCFPKDLQSLAGMLPRESIVGAIHKSNEQHKHYLAQRIRQKYGDDLSGTTFALWGLAFKESTDDVRESPALVIARDLAFAGARIRAHDEAAAANAARELADLGDAITYHDDKYDACDADALVIATNWEQYKSPDYRLLAQRLRKRAVFDGRNILNVHEATRAGLRYYGMGRNGKQ